jgi:glycosyltransferase involved in cell wall biosynthesis
MISVVVCTSHSPSRDLHQRNVAKTAGTAYEYIRIDNRQNRYSLSGAYNRGVSLARGDIVVFVHDDVFFMEPGWGDVLERKFDTDRSLGLIGVAGTQYLCEDIPLWARAGQPFIRGRVVHELDNGNEFFMTVFSWDKSDAAVVAVDGLFFAIPRRLFTEIHFDEKTFDGYHFYDLDICMQVCRRYRALVTWDILVKHCSSGAFDEEWKEYAGRFVKKYRTELPASCVPGTPELKTRRVRRGENYDLKGKVPQLTIA